MNICTIWGGTAQAGLLQILATHLDISSLTGIVCTTDNGGSSRIVRDSLEMPSPGDVRNCLNHISDTDSTLGSLLNYRFEDGELSGTHLGNLIIWALTQMHGSLEAAVSKLSWDMDLVPTILPVSNTSTNICATLTDGSHVVGERNIIKRKNRSAIESFHLEDDQATVLPAVTQAIAHSDYIIICPGVLGTAIISTLLHDWLHQAIADNPDAKIIYFCNIFTYASQTDGRSVSDHVRCLESYLPRSVDHLIVNTDESSPDLIEYYGHRNHHMVTLDLDNISDDTRIRDGYFIQYVDAASIQWLERASNKKQHVWTHVVRPDSEKVLDVMSRIFGTSQTS